MDGKSSWSLPQPLSNNEAEFAENAAQNCKGYSVPSPKLPKLPSPRQQNAPKRTDRRFIGEIGRHDIYFPTAPPFVSVRFSPISAVSWVLS
jgi:hypothetical protein